MVFSFFWYNTYSLSPVLKTFLYNYMSRQIMILAAGKGTRMAGATPVPIPKVIIPLGDKPVIQHLLAEVEKIETSTPPIIVVGYESDKVKDALGDKYLYALQSEQKGSGHAVLAGKDLVTADSVLVLNGDMPFITAESLQKLIDAHESTQAKVSMITGRLPNFEGVYQHFNSFGRIIRDSEDHIEKIQEYLDCTDEQKQITEVNSGEYMFNSEWLWPHLEKIGSHNAQGEVYLTDIIELAIKDGQKIKPLEVSPEELYGINTPDHLDHAKSIIK
jgi:bifunctional UDP-N-acetylglucosamine pyrophosphorylase/glucosamine-1-phosphate N-acetyltransferase